METKNEEKDYIKAIKESKELFLLLPLQEFTNFTSTLSAIIYKYISDSFSSDEYSNPLLDFLLKCLIRYEPEQFPTFFLSEILSLFILLGVDFDKYNFLLYTKLKRSPKGILEKLIQSANDPYDEKMLLKLLSTFMKYSDYNKNAIKDTIQSFNDNFVRFFEKATIKGEKHDNYFFMPDSNISFNSENVIQASTDINDYCFCFLSHLYRNEMNRNEHDNKKNRNEYPLFIMVFDKKLLCHVIYNQDTKRYSLKYEQNEVYGFGKVDYSLSFNKKEENLNLTTKDLFKTCFKQLLEKGFEIPIEKISTEPSDSDESDDNKKFHDSYTYFSKQMDTISSYINANALSLMSKSDSRIQLCSYVNFLTSQIYQNCKLYEMKLNEYEINDTGNFVKFEPLYDNFLVNCNSLLTIMDILSQPLDEKSKQNLIEEFKLINYNHQMIHSNDSKSFFLEQKLPEKNLIDNKKANEIISKIFILLVLYSTKLGTFYSNQADPYYLIYIIRPGEGVKYDIVSFFTSCFGKYSKIDFEHSKEESAKQGIRPNFNPKIPARNPKVNIGLFIERFNSQSIQFINKKFDEFVDNFEYLIKNKLCLKTNY